MSNLKIGDAVFYAGKKRTVQSVKKACGFTLIKMVGHAYMVRSDLVKPVIRVTELVRARMLVEFCRSIAEGLPKKDLLMWDILGNQNYIACFRDYSEALRLLQENSFKLEG